MTIQNSGGSHSNSDSCTNATYDDPTQAPAQQTESNVDEQALEHLRSLGYIE
jgi:hypothetical protein